MFRKKDKIDINRATYLKCFAGYYLMEDWIKVKQKGKSLVKFFEDNNIDEIAVYGMAELGKLVCLELKDSNIKVRCGIDRRLDDKKDSPVKVVDFYDVKKYIDVQAIVVTPIQYFNEIQGELRKFTDANIISLEDVIYYMKN